MCLAICIVPWTKTRAQWWLQTFRRGDTDPSREPAAHLQAGRLAGCMVAVAAGSAVHNECICSSYTRKPRRKCIWLCLSNPVPCWLCYSLWVMAPGNN